MNLGKRECAILETYLAQEYNLFSEDLCTMLCKLLVPKDVFSQIPQSTFNLYFYKLNKILEQCCCCSGSWVLPLSHTVCTIPTVHQQTLLWAALALVTWKELPSTYPWSFFHGYKSNMSIPKTLGCECTSSIHPKLIHRETLLCNPGLWTCFNKSTCIVLAGCQAPF